jgi:hypothetical protein
MNRVRKSYLPHRRRVTKAENDAVLNPLTPASPLHPMWQDTTGNQSDCNDTSSSGGGWDSGSCGGSDSGGNGGGGD